MSSIQTFFSTSFFNFEDGTNAPITSKWIWLYFVVTGGLTAIVLSCAFIIWRRKEDELRVQFKQDSKEDSKEDKKEDELEI